MASLMLQLAVEKDVTNNMSFSCDQAPEQWGYIGFQVLIRLQCLEVRLASRAESASRVK